MCRRVVMLSRERVAFRMILESTTLEGWMMTRLGMDVRGAVDLRFGRWDHHACGHDTNNNLGRRVRYVRLNDALESCSSSVRERWFSISCPAPFLVSMCCSYCAASRRRFFACCAVLPVSSTSSLVLYERTPYSRKTFFM
jgi:hypothetical protein